MRKKNLNKALESITAPNPKEVDIWVEPKDDDTVSLKYYDYHEDKWVGAEDSDSNVEQCGIVLWLVNMYGPALQIKIEKIDNGNNYHVKIVNMHYDKNMVNVVYETYGVINEYNDSVFNERWLQVDLPPTVLAEPFDFGWSGNAPMGIALYSQINAEKPLYLYIYSNLYNGELCSTDYYPAGKFPSPDFTTDIYFRSMNETEPNIHIHWPVLE